MTERLNGWPSKTSLSNYPFTFWDFPGGLDGKKRLPTMRETWVQPLGWEDPLEKEMASHSSILLEESHGQRSLVGCSPWGR